MIHIGNYDQFIPYKALNPLHPIENLYFRVDFQRCLLSVAYLQFDIWKEEWRVDVALSEISKLVLIIAAIEQDIPLKSGCHTIENEVRRIVAENM